ncbi:hypothetical protein [Bradyrhizobium sp. AZCC 2262]|uniref:hypothetical protein n=1 Tax=Bradyrhizobium sp. AZCC 2262 TaxID=3117022 RepID=UPI002FF3416B
MTSLYGKLFKYRSRAARSPLEDYLTECLTDLFNRLDGETQKHFVRRVFMPTGVQQQWDEFSSAIDVIRMETQHVILKGRIDLVVFAGSDPIVAVEHKIGAPISEDSDGNDQLEIYGRWITASKPDAFPGVICLLTHLTQPNEGFLDEARRSCGAKPHVVTWGSLAAALININENIGTLQADVATLICELVLFLEEMNMSHEFAGRDEFASAFVYLRAGSRMDHTFETIYNHVKSLKGCFATGRSIHESSLYFDTKRSLIWGWNFLSHQTFSDLFFGYGIALAPAVTFGSASIQAPDAVFLCVGADNKRSMQSLRAAKDVPEKPWTYVDLGDWSAVICFKSLHSFMADPEQFALKMNEWIDESEASVNKFVSSYLK